MTASKRAFYTALFVATASYSSIAVAPVCAQEAVIKLDLPSQDLATTLRTIARQGGKEILFAEEEVAGRQSPTLRGSFTVEHAAQLAVSGSGLAVAEQAGALIVRPAGRRKADDIASPEITVTGSRIRGATGPSPVIMVSRRGLEEQGIPDMASVSRIIPQNFTGGQNPGVAGGGEQSGYNNVNNSTTLNLRGLGSDATLTLINGHRLPYDAVNQGVDISIIPLAALERIEVITDGASALYGSENLLRIRGCTSGKTSLIVSPAIDQLTPFSRGCGNGGPRRNRPFAILNDAGPHFGLPRISAAASEHSRHGCRTFCVTSWV